MKGLVSLSTAIFTLLCTALFTSDPASFLLLLSVLPFIICTFAMVFLRPVPPSSDAAEDELEHNNFTFLNIMSIIIAIYLFAFTIMVEIFRVPPLVYKIYSVGLLLLLASPLAFPLKIFITNLLVPEDQAKDDLFHRNESDEGKPLLNGDEKDKAEADQVEETQRPAHNGVATAGLDNECGAVGPDQASGSQQENGATTRNGSAGAIEKADTHLPISDGGGVHDASRGPKLGEDFPIFGALCTLDFWLLFVTFLCGIGTGITAINNLGQIGQSLGYDDVAVFVSLVSIWGFFGRLGAGALSEHYVQ